MGSPFPGSVSPSPPRIAIASSCPPWPQPSPKIDGCREAGLSMIFTMVSRMWLQQRNTVHALVDRWEGAVDSTLHTTLPWSARQAKGWPASNKGEWNKSDCFLMWISNIAHGTDISVVLMY